MGSSLTPQSISTFQGAKAESGILKVDTKKDLEGKVQSEASAWTQTGGKKRRVFFQTHRPKKKQGGFLAMICGTFGIWFLCLKKVSKNPTEPKQTNRMVGCSATVAGRIFFCGSFFGVLNLKVGAWYRFRYVL